MRQTLLGTVFPLKGPPDVPRFAIQSASAQRSPKCAKPRWAQCIRSKVPPTCRTSLFKVLTHRGPPNAPNLVGAQCFRSTVPPTCHTSLFNVPPPRGPPDAPNLTGHNVSARRSPWRAAPRYSKCFRPEVPQMYPTSLGTVCPLKGPTDVPHLAIQSAFV